MERLIVWFGRIQLSDLMDHDGRDIERYFIFCLAGENHNGQVEASTSRLPNPLTLQARYLEAIFSLGKVFSQLETMLRISVSVASDAFNLANRNRGKMHSP